MAVAGVISLAAVILLLHATIASGTLTIYHGRVSQNGATIIVVRGVTVLNIGSGVNHFFDCGTTEGTTSDLTWEKNEGIQRFPVTTENYNYEGEPISTLRMDFAPGGENAGYSDVGGYTCTNTVTGEMMSINITGGATAVCPVQASEEVTLGLTAELRIYAEAEPPLASHEIEWKRSDGTPVSTDSRVSLHDSNYRLVIRNVNLQDSGVYRIEIVRETGPVVYQVLASTAIDLNVHVDVEVLSSPASAMVLEHVDVTFTCMFSGNPLPSILWEREGSADLPVQTRRNIETTSITNDTFTFHTVTSVLTIMGVLYEDEGRYRCVAANTLTGGVERSASSAFAELTVTPRIQLEVNDPNEIENGLAYVSENSRVEIVCSGSGALNWESSTGVTIPVENNDLSPPSNIFQRFDITTNNQILVIQSFSSANDVASYTCETDLTVGGITFYEVVFITASDPAVFIDDETVYTAAGSSAQISATVYSSTQNGLVVEWRHEDSPISTTNDPHYSQTTMGTSVYILTITNVTVDVLGSYTAVVTVGEDTQSYSVQLAFHDPPTASINPPTSSISLEGMVTFQCVAGGTETTVEWGPQPLPSGVVQSGSDLVIAQATRDHAGQYVCTVSNSAGSVTSTATLTVNYAPTTIITREGTTQSSNNGVLQVTAEQGDLAPTFSCSADGSPPPTISWGGKDGSVTLPDGVSQTSNSQNQALVWSRPLEYGDSGQYPCSAMNTVGTSAATLNLLVRNPPTIITIAPTSPVSSTTATNFMVPQGYSGNVVTCTALGWPTPTIEWRREGGNLTASVMSVLTREEGSAYVTARLRWLDEFQESDAGRYICEVRASDTDLVSSATISLEMTSGSVAPPTPTPATCTLNSQTVYFQVRVLDTNCEIWGPELQSHITSKFETELVSIVNARCQDCDVTGSDLEVTGVATCSDQVTRGAVFRGMIDTLDQERTQEIFCTLSMWQQTGPLVLVNNDLHLVDKSCTVQSDSPTSAECALAGTDFPVIIVAASAGGASALILFVIILLTCCCCCYCCHHKCGSKKDEMKMNGRRNGHASQYERTRHESMSGANLMRYTDSVNPESYTDGASPTEETNIYSTLNQNEMSSFPPPPPFLLEMETRNGPGEAPNMNGKPSIAQQPFLITGAGLVGGAPEPYQVAVSSKEDLCHGNTPVGTVVGHHRSSSSGRYVTNIHSGGGRGNEHAKLSHTLSTGAVPYGSEVFSSTHPQQRQPYELIDRQYNPKYGVNEFTSSSPKMNNIPDGQRGRGGYSASVRAGSSGHVMVPPSRGIGIRRFTSATDTRPSGGPLGGSPGEIPDYAHLDRGEEQFLPMPSSGHEQQRRARNASASSFSASISNSSDQPHPFANRHNITNYSRGSPRQPGSAMGPGGHTHVPPVSINEATPPYRDTSISASSATSSSLMDNDAYEVSSQHVQGANVEGASLSDLKEEQPWYVHNASDLSLRFNDHQQHQKQQQQHQQQPPEDHHQQLDNNVSPYHRQHQAVEGHDQQQQEEVESYQQHLDSNNILPYQHQQSNDNISPYHHNHHHQQQQHQMGEHHRTRPYPYSDAVQSDKSSTVHMPEHSNAHLHTVMV